VGDAADIRLDGGRVVAALDAGLRGMRVGGRRRINVRPERGWKLPDAQCLTTYTDVTIVPTTKVQENDACFNGQGIPGPSNYAARRRMLRRYDETLIVDVELVEVLDAA
jgi:FKBP-type peptidyl-prolyl cis-trans isomerase 2